MIGTIAATGQALFANASTTNLSVSGIFNVIGTSTLATTTITNLTVAQAPTISSFTSGIVHSNGSGLLSSSAVALGSSDVSGVLPIINGGTGTSTAPSLNQILIGNASSGYNLVATSTLGLQVAGSYVTNSYASSTFPSFNYSSSTYAFASSFSGTNGQVAYFTSGSNVASASDFLNNGTVAGVNASSSTVSFNVQGSGTLNPFNVASSSGASELFVGSNGNVGIGTTGTVATLSVNGTIGIKDNFVSSTPSALSGYGNIYSRAESDPSFNNVSYLLHMDGTNGSTTFTDSSNNAVAVTAHGATLSTSQVKFGTAAGSFNGSSYISIPDSANVEIGASDFTFESWVYINSYSGSLILLMSKRGGNVVFFILN